MTNSNVEKHGNSRSTISSSIKEERYRKQTHKKLIVSFILMLAFTVCSFYAVVSESIPNSFAVPFILVLAILQVVLQLVIFMHLDEKGSGYLTIIICAGIYFAVVTVAALMLLIWW